MVLKIRYLLIVSLLLLVMLFSGIVSSIDFSGELAKSFDFSKVSKAVTDNFAFKVYKPDRPNLFVGGILQKSSNGDLAEPKWKKFADQNDATFVPTYYTIITDINAVNDAANYIATDVNGLTRDELKDEKYGTIIGYSGGTTTVVEAMANQGVKADTLILISPMTGNIIGKEKFEKKIQTILDRGTKIVVIQSPDDKGVLGIGQYNFVGSPFEDKVQIVSKNGLSHTAIFDTYAMQNIKVQNIKDGVYVDPKNQDIEPVNQPPKSIGEAIAASRERLARAPAKQDETQATKSPVTLTLYVRDGSASGPVIPGAQVTGQDASGNSFQQTTDSNGYVTITGDSGTWSLSASAEGYETNSWNQEITETDTKHAFLQDEQQQESAVPTTPVTLTLYVRDGSASGPIISGAQVTGHDGSGNSIEHTTDSSGYLIITGDPGTWSFSVSKDGYDTNSWDQEITETDTKHAYLMKSAAPVSQGSGNSVVGKWDLQEESEDVITLYGQTSTTYSCSHSIIDFHDDGTFTDSGLESYYQDYNGVWVEAESDTASRMATGEWIQYDDTIRLQYNPMPEERDEGNADGEYFIMWQSEGDTCEGTIKSDIMSGTGSGLTHINYHPPSWNPSGSFSYDSSYSFRWTASRVAMG